MSNKSIPVILGDDGLTFPEGHGIPDWITRSTTPQLYESLAMDPLNSRETAMVHEELERRDNKATTRGRK